MEARILAPQNTPIRLLVGGDYAILRQGIRLLLNKGDDFEVVGEAENEKAALLLTMKLQPDIVLLDSLLGGMNGLHVAKQLLRGCPGARIVLFADSTDETLLFEALQAGVYGYLQKTTSLDDLRKALHAVHTGERVLGEVHTVTQVVVELRRLTKEYSRLSRGLGMGDIELMRLVSNGYTNKEIGKQLAWSEITVKRKMQGIYRKLHVSDRAQAVAEVMRQGLI